MGRGKRSNVRNSSKNGAIMDVKDAIRVLAEEIADSRFPMKNGTKEEFYRIIKDSKDHYGSYQIFSEMVDIDGNETVVEFHSVGRNASHSFSIGVLPDGRFIRRSCGEGMWDEENDCPSVEINVSVVNNIGYVGHW